ncbi:MAG: DNA/RNA nuclease SfsA [Candidatus Bilamarchaeaceae archaeon]
MRFPIPLKRGLILARPNRFIMKVLLDGERIKCHCPSTGRIGDIIFKGIPCLVSLSSDPNRKTKGTVEAISVDGGKGWIGINQNKANDYVYALLKEGKLPGITKSREIRREVSVGKSRIDFVAGKDLIEVKTPLISLPGGKGIAHRKKSRFNSFGRLIRHFSELGKSMGKGRRAALLMCYLYDAEPFVPPETDNDNARIKDAARKASGKGVENWQINFRIDRKGVELVRYFRLELFR